MLNQNLSLLERLLAPTPRLFTIIRNIAIIVSVLVGLIITLQSHGINLPDWLIFFKDKAVWMGGIIAAIIAQLTVDYQAKAKAEAIDDKTLKGYNR